MSMTNLHTLRNILPLFIALIFIGCNKNDSLENSSTIEVKTYSSEDDSYKATVGEIRDPETGEVVCIVQQK